MSDAQHRVVNALVVITGTYFVLALTTTLNATQWPATALAVLVLSLSAAGFRWRIPKGFAPYTPAGAGALLVLVIGAVSQVSIDGFDSALGMPVTAATLLIVAPAIGCMGLLTSAYARDDESNHRLTDVLMAAGGACMAYPFIVEWFAPTGILMLCVALCFLAGLITVQNSLPARIAMAVACAAALAQSQNPSIPLHFNGAKLLGQLEQGDFTNGWTAAGATAFVETKQGDAMIVRDGGMSLAFAPSKARPPSPWPSTGERALLVGLGGGFELARLRQSYAQVDVVGADPGTWNLLRTKLAAFTGAQHLKAHVSTRTGNPLRALRRDAYDQVVVSLPPRRSLSPVGIAGFADDAWNTPEARDLLAAQSTPPGKIWFAASQSLRERFSSANAPHEQAANDPVPLALLGLLAGILTLIVAPVLIRRPGSRIEWFAWAAVGATWTAWGQQLTLRGDMDTLYWALGALLLGLSQAHRLGGASRTMGFAVLIGLAIASSYWAGPPTPLSAVLLSGALGAIIRVQGIAGWGAAVAAGLVVGNLVPDGPLPGLGFVVPAAIFAALGAIEFRNS